MDDFSFSENRILMNEIYNDGSMVHLYYHPLYGRYMAYGISAYVVNCAVNSVRPTYDHNLQMPKVEVNDEQIDMLKKKMECILFIENDYYQFEGQYDDRDYNNWANHIRNQ